MERSDWLQLHDVYSLHVWKMAFEKLALDDIRGMPGSCVKYQRLDPMWICAPKPIEINGLGLTLA